MPLDASIYSNIQQPKFESPMNLLAQVMQMQGAQNQNSMAQYGLKKAQRMDSQQNALMSALQGGGIDLTTPEGQMKAISLAPDAAGPIIKAATEAQLSRSTIGKNDAQAGDYTAKATTAALSQFRDQLSNVQNPDQAAQWMQAQYQHPLVGKVVQALGPVDQALARIPTDQAGFQQWKQQNALGMTKYIELNAPKTNVVDTGGMKQMVQTPGLGGAPTVAGTFKNTVSPDAQLSASTSRANNAANIAKDYVVAGVQPGGGIDQNSESLAQAIASGQLPPPTGIAMLNPKNRAILERVMKINPQYDYTAITAKKAAATSFASGPLGNALRSVSTANAHLDQLGELADAMNNGNVQVVNKVQNYFKTQTGSPSATNFDAIKQIVGQEVVKAIVAGGGSMAERDEAAKIFSSSSSPAQLKGAIQHYRMVMGAQANNLMEQRHAAGIPDSTLPDYSKTNSSAPAAAPAGWGIERVN